MVPRHPAHGKLVRMGPRHCLSIQKYTHVNVCFAAPQLQLRIK